MPRFTLLLRPGGGLLQRPAKAAEKAAKTVKHRGIFWPKAPHAATSGCPVRMKQAGAFAAPSQGASPKMARLSHPGGTARAGIEIQTYCAIIACRLLGRWTGGQPTQRTFETVSL